MAVACLRPSQCQPDDPADPSVSLGINRFCVAEREEAWRQKEEKRSEALSWQLYLCDQCHGSHPKRNVKISRTEVRLYSHMVNAQNPRLPSKVMCGGTEGPVQSNWISRCFGKGQSNIYHIVIYLDHRLYTQCSTLTLCFNKKVAYKLYVLLSSQVASNPDLFL